MENGFLIFSIMSAPLITVVVLFKYQNQVKSTTAMHSYPLSRNQLLTTNALAGMTLLTLPLFALCKLMIIPMLLYPGLFICISDLIIFFFMAAIALLLYLSIYMVAAMLSGNSIITLLLCFALPLLPIALYALIGLTLEFYVSGFSASWINPLDILVYIYPVLFPLNWDESYYTLFMWVSYSAIIIAMAACCVFATNKRAHERAGDSVVFPYAKNVLVFILSVFGLILMGFIFLAMFSSSFAMYVGFAIGFFIAYCIAQMIAEKTFNIVNKLKDFKKFGAIAGGLLLLLIVVTRSDIFGYERYVPRIEDIQGVQILDVRFLFDNRNELANTDLSELLVKDIDIINETVNLHQAIISERAELMRVERYTSNQHTNILYKLENGNVVVRRYRLDDSFRNRNNVHGLEISSRLSTSLLQNRPYLINNIAISRFGFQRSSYQPPDISIHRDDHILEFIDALMKDRDIVNLPGANSLHVEIMFTPEGFSRLSRMDSLSFRVANNDQSYVLDWLRKTSYLD